MDYIYFKAKLAFYDCWKCREGAGRRGQGLRGKQIQLAFWVPVLDSLYIYKMKKLNNWTDQEDELLLELYGQADCFQKWKYISEKFISKGFSRNQIECRERFVNKLNPELRQDKLEKSQLKNLFGYYNQYGPLWSVFESLIPGRSQNLLKNKFYSTLRTLVRLLLTQVDAEGKNQGSFCSASISSKLLIEVYEGKKNFRRFKGFLASILKKLDFQLDLQKISCINTPNNIKIITNIHSEILKTLSTSPRGSGYRKLSRRGTQLKTIQKNAEGPAKEQKLSPQEQTREKLAKPEDNSMAELQGNENWQQGCMAFCVPFVNQYNLYMPVWGYFPFSQGQPCYKLQ